MSPLRMGQCCLLVAKCARAAGLAAPAYENHLPVSTGGALGTVASKTAQAIGQRLDGKTEPMAPDTSRALMQGGDLSHLSRVSGLLILAGQCGLACLLLLPLLLLLLVFFFF